MDTDEIKTQLLCDLEEHEIIEVRKLKLLKGWTVTLSSPPFFAYVQNFIREDNVDLDLYNVMIAFQQMKRK